MAQVGRNDPCRCGSSKKYKSCCQRRDERGARRLRPWAAGRPTADCLLCGDVLPLSQLRIFPDMWVRSMALDGGGPARACASCARVAEQEERDAARP